MTRIKLQELLGHLAEYLKVHEFKDYCINGAQIRGKEELQKVAFSTSASLEVIEKAIQEKADALIVHHGLFWDKDDRSLEGPLKTKVKEMLTHDMSLLAYHLPLDAHKIVGNNFNILRSLGFEQIKHYESIGAIAQESIRVQDLIDKVKAVFGIEPLIPPIKKTQLSNVACVSGGGHSFFKQAPSNGVEAFISGTTDEWVWDFAKENNILFIPLGHYRSEVIGVKKLMEYVEATFGLHTMHIEHFNPY